MLTHKLTAAIFTKNEEKRLRITLANFSGLIPCIIIDNHSTDGTRSIAYELGIPFHVVANPGHFENSETMRAVNELCQTPYLLIASCAEFIPFSLLSIYARCAENDSYDIVRATRISITAGHEVPISVSLAKSHPGELRMMRKGAVDYSNNQVHSVGKAASPDTRTCRLPHTRELSFFQFRDYDCATSEINHCRYNDLWAKQRYAAGERFSWPRAIILSFCRFAKPYFYLGAWKNGSLGLIHCIYRFTMELTIQFRIWELQTNTTAETIRESNLRIRTGMLDDLKKNTLEQ